MSTTDVEREPRAEADDTMDFISGGKPIIWFGSAVFLLATIFYTPPAEVTSWDALLQRLLTPGAAGMMVFGSVLAALIGPIPTFKQTLKALIAMAVGVVLLFISAFFEWGLLFWFLLGIPLSMGIARLVIVRHETDRWWFKHGDKLPIQIPPGDGSTLI